MPSPAGMSLRYGQTTIPNTAFPWTPLGAGAAAVAAGEGWPQAGGAKMPQGRLQSVRPRGAALTCRLHVLSSAQRLPANAARSKTLRSKARPGHTTQDR